MPSKACSEKTDHLVLCVVMGASRSVVFGAFGSLGVVSPAMIGVSHGAVQFVAYEQLRRFVKSQNLESDAGYFVAG